MKCEELKLIRDKAICKEIIEVLLWNIVEQPSLTLNYGELSERIQGQIKPCDLSSRMALVFHCCTKVGCPPLPVIVVHQKEKRPSQWFYRHYEVIHQLEDVNEWAIFEQELSNVYYYPEWEKVAKRLNLDEQLIIRLEKRSQQLKEHLTQNPHNATHIIS